MIYTYPDVVEISKIIGAILVILTFVKLIYDFVSKLYKRITGEFNKYWKLFVESLAKLDFVYTEIKPNHGSSLYDKINRISKDFEQIKKEMAIQSHRTLQIRDDMFDVGYYEADNFGSFTFGNQKLCQLFGMDYEELLGNGWLSSVHERDRERIFKDWKNLIDKNIPFQASFTAVNQATREELEVWTKVEVVRDSVGQTLHFFGKLFKK